MLITMHSSTVHGTPDPDPVVVCCFQLHFDGPVFSAVSACVPLPCRKSSSHWFLYVFLRFNWTIWECKYSSTFLLQPRLDSVELARPAFWSRLQNLRPPTTGSRRVAENYKRRRLIICREDGGDRVRQGKECRSDSGRAREHLGRK